MHLDTLEIRPITITREQRTRRMRDEKSRCILALPLAEQRNHGTFAHHLLIERIQHLSSSPTGTIHFMQLEIMRLSAGLGGASGSWSIKSPTDQSSGNASQHDGKQESQIKAKVVMEVNSLSDLLIWVFGALQQRRHDAASQESVRKIAILSMTRKTVHPALCPNAKNNIYSR